MDQIAHRVLRFDRFTLDFVRGCVRGPDRDIELRPKVFEVLCYLAENAGRLVPKQELVEAVWPNVFVSDDSLAQCISELREKLGDHEHRVIKTVSRRGYILDTTIAAAPPVTAEPPTDLAAAAGQTTAVAPAPTPRLWGAAVGVLCVVSALAYLIGRSQAPGAKPHGLAGSPASSEPARSTFKDCDGCPEMVALPAGEFMMGSPENERFRTEEEGLPRRVTIGRSFAIGRFEITNAQFEAFIADTGTPISRQCRLISGYDGTHVTWTMAEASFREPGYAVTGSHPVACMSWHDAQTYVAWLRRRTGKPYRLPTEAEWEYAARASTSTTFSFGNDVTEACAYARIADLATPLAWRAVCRSEFATYGPIEVGKLKPNAWGLHDMHGNVWEWVEDCWTASPSEIPTDGSATTRPGHCELGVTRGGSWASLPSRMRSAIRVRTLPALRLQNFGFRIALSLGK